MPATEIHHWGHLLGTKRRPFPTLLTQNPLFPLVRKKKGKGKKKKKGSDDSDSDALEVIKEWNTSSRGGDPAGRNRAEPVEEGEPEGGWGWGGRVDRWGHLQS